MIKSVAASAVAGLLMLSACGGEDSSAVPSPVPVPAPTPTPTPSPSPTPTPTLLSPKEEIVAALASGPSLRFAASDGSASVTLRRGGGNSAIPDGIHISHTDERLLLLSGPYAVSSVFPLSTAKSGQAITNGDPSIIGPTGLPEWRSSLHAEMRFTLPAGQNRFELVTLAAGGGGGLFVFVDGVSTNLNGYKFGASDGRTDYSYIELPASDAPRAITLLYGGRPTVGLRLPQGDTLGVAPDMTNAARVVFIGDSILAGAGASDPTMAFGVQAATRLGFRDFVISAVGGSGYLAPYPQNRGYNFADRFDDVLRAFPRRPSGIVIAGGINDCSVAPGGLFTAAETGAAAGQYLRRLRAALPETPIFVLGPFTGPGTGEYSQTSRNCQEAIFAEARTIPLTYTIDVADWVTPANVDVVFDGKANGPHPIDSGHAIYAERLEKAIREIVGSWPEMN